MRPLNISFNVKELHLAFPPIAVVVTTGPTSDVQGAKVYLYRLYEKFQILLKTLEMLYNLDRLFEFLDKLSWILI